MLPHNLDAEASILGGIILHNEWLEHLDTLEIDHFYHHQHKVVFGAIRNLQAKGKPLDVVTIADEIAHAGKSEATGGIAFLGELVLRVPTVDNVIAYAKIVRESALIRDVILKASQHADRGYGWEYEADEFLGELLADLQQLERGHREANEKLPIITVGGALEEIERLAKTPIFETPFDELNRALGFGGPLGGQVYYLAGGTGFGKTSFIGKLAKHHAMQGRPALIAFWEMFAGYYVARMAAPILGVHSNDIIRAQLAPGDVMRALPPMIEFLDAPSMSTLKRACERHVRAGRGAPLLFVDYLQLFADQILATMTRPDARLANTQASGCLRALAKETGAAVIAVCAAGRSSSKRLVEDVRKKPPRDLVDAAKESGSIEFDGAGVIVLSVADEKDADGANIATITVAKARFGEPTHIDARYDGRTGNWTEIGRVVRGETTTPSSSEPAIDLREAILAQLRIASAPSRTKLAERLGKNKSAALAEMKAMLEEKLIRQTSKGIELAEITSAIPATQIEIATEITSAPQEHG